MKSVHEHPLPGEPGLRKETEAELQVRIADAQRAAAHHLAVRSAIVEMLRVPSLTMIEAGQVMMDDGHGPACILEAMVTQGLLELFEAGKL